MSGELKPPIFLLGNVRSGTTMMWAYFDLHPDVKSWYEPRTVWVYADPCRKHDRFDADDATPRVTRYIRNRFLRYQKSHSGRRVMEKTPSNLVRIPYVQKIFPEAKYLYMVRNPLSYLSSSEIKWRKAITLKHMAERLWESPTSQLPYYGARLFLDHFRKKVLRKKHVSVWGIRYEGIYNDIKTMEVEQVIAKQWAYASRQAAEDLKQVDPSKVLYMRYEDFVADPGQKFATICRHFDLPVNEDVLQKVNADADPNRQTKWKRLDPQLLKRCITHLRDEMDRHGYTVPDELSDETDTTIK